jgi:uncharacterized FAD-dependent dehydrogenase
MPGPAFPAVERVIRTLVPEGVAYEPVPQLTALAAHGEAGLRFESYPLLHVGSDGVRQFGLRYSADLQARGVVVLTGVEALELTFADRRATGAVLRDFRDRSLLSIRAPSVIVASGLMGTRWLEGQLRAQGVGLRTGPADIGIRLETTAEALEPFISEFYDFKIAHCAQDGMAVRSFCVNGNGFVVNEYHRPLGIRGVNGHSFLGRRSGLSNLAILATVTERFTPDPKAYVRKVARRVNDGAGGYPARQKLAAFLPDAARGPALGLSASNPKTRDAPLHDLLPRPIHEAFAGYLRTLGAVLPPLLAPDAVVYAPEIKYYNYRVPIDHRTWESTDLRGLFVVGNAAGYTASLSAAALTGIIAARTIVHRTRATPPERAGAS